MEVDFLLGSQVQALLSTHPNSFGNLDTIPDVNWPLLVQFYVSGQSDQPIPQDLAKIINQIKFYQLPRTPMHIPNLLKLPSEVGMSPKKSHEVTRMVTYIVRLIHANNLVGDRLRIVDAGAGQGYLTRSLKYYLPRARILALDADAAQTIGAQKWERRLLPDAHPPIEHKTVEITPQSLLSVVDEWVNETRSKNQSDNKCPIPVLFVALHACGSLTLDILRAYVSSREGAVWSGTGVVAVGCCYNLMRPADFPLSRAYGLSGDRPFQLPNSAFHLAAQVPSEWLQSVSPPTPTPSVSLAIKKVVFRAILTRLLQKALPRTTWSSEENPPTVLEDCCVEPRGLATTRLGYTPRLGKLNDRLYSSWSTFMRAVEQKLAVKFAEDVFDEEVKGFAYETAKATFESKLQVLHTMRCLLGSVVESTILRDRVKWVKDALSGSELQVQLVNLFDQSTGSGRNVAIIIAPQLPVFEDLPN